MDPVTAFGLACNVVQLVNCSLDIASKCREVYKTGALEENRDTAEDARVLLEFTVAVDGGLRGGRAARVVLSKGDQTLWNLGTQCRKTATELLEILSQLEADSKSGVLRKVFNNYRMAGRIERLQEKLSKQRQALDERVLIDLSIRIRLMDQRGEIHSEGLDRQVQIFVEELRKNATTVQDLTRSIQIACAETQSLVKTSSAEVRDHISDEAEATRVKFRDAQAATEAQLARLQLNPIVDMRKRVRQSLAFREMSLRQMQIDNACSKTFQWIFEPQESAMPERWSNFREWLERGHGIYWVNGKAGSGKSTLMNFIWQSQDMIEALRIWAGALRLMTPGFFFWSAGSPMQRSSEGLLRAVMYQILTKDNGAAAMLERNLDSAGRDLLRMGRDIVWSEKTLITGLSSLIGGIHGTRFCLFIDGLDEVIGDQMRLVDTMMTLAEYSNVKICLSSRPLPIFQHRFRTCPQLRLQDLTVNDIEAYTSQMLAREPLIAQAMRASPNEAPDLVRPIAEKADGVFLWVCLVVKDVLEAVIKGDTFFELKVRVSDMPLGLDMLFTKMFDSIELRHRPDAVKYIKTMLAMQEHSEHRFMHFTLASWDRVQQDDTSSIFLITQSEANTQCDFVSGRLAARTAGLVEVLNDASYDDSHVRTRVSFVHRTAFDYLSSSEHMPEWISAKRERTPACHLNLLKAQMIDTLWDVNSSDIVLKNATVYLVAPKCTNVLDTACYNEDLVDAEMQASFLDSFGDRLQACAERRLHKKRTSGTNAWWASALSSGSNTAVRDFYGLAARHRLHQYCSRRLAATATTDKAKLASYFLLCTLEHTRDSMTREYRDLSDDRRMVEMLLSHGADPCHLYPPFASLYSGLRQKGPQMQSGVSQAFPAENNLPQTTCWGRIAAAYVDARDFADPPYFQEYQKIIQAFLQAGAQLSHGVDIIVPIMIPLRRSVDGPLVTLWADVCLEITVQYLLLHGVSESEYDWQSFPPARFKCIHIGADSVEGSRTYWFDDWQSKVLSQTLLLKTVAEDWRIIPLACIEQHHETSTLEDTLTCHVRMTVAPYLCSHEPERFRYEDFEALCAASEGYHHCVGWLPSGSNNGTLQGHFVSADGGEDSARGRQYSDYFEDASSPTSETDIESFMDDLSENSSELTRTRSRSISYSLSVGS